MTLHFLASMPTGNCIHGNKQKSGFKSSGLACTGKVHSLYLTVYDFINCETDF